MISIIAQQQIQLERLFIMLSWASIVRITLEKAYIIFFSSFFQVPPSITGAEEETFVQAPVNTSITLICPTIGTPQPAIQWFKADHELPIFDINDQYIIPSIKPTDEGVYRCVATNKAGSAQRRFNVSVYRKKISL